MYPQNIAVGTCFCLRKQFLENTPIVGETDDVVLWFETVDGGQEE